jgi:membrane associated rhomboid family serine protease
VEREMGTIPFLLVYFAGGIYGFVLGGNFSRTGIPSVGASGALFATVGARLASDLIPGQSS